MEMAPLSAENSAVEENQLRGIELATDCVFFISHEHRSSTVVSRGKGSTVLVSIETKLCPWLPGKPICHQQQWHCQAAHSSPLTAGLALLSESGSGCCQDLDFEGRGIKRLKRISVVTKENTLPFLHLLLLFTCPYTWETPACPHKFSRDSLWNYW